MLVRDRQNAQLPLHEPNRNGYQPMQPYGRINLQTGLVKIGAGRKQNKVTGFGRFAHLTGDEGYHNVTVRTDNRGQAKRRTQFTPRKIIERERHEDDAVLHSAIGLPSFNE